MISLADLGAGILLLGLIMYALFGGADFGGGIWTAFASGPRKKEQEDSLFHAIGPVWETNHIWLIFIIVVLFMVFPKGFAALFIALLPLLVLALIGINFRGAAFAFRHFGHQSGRHNLPLIARTFSIASLLTPFTLGMSVTAVASGEIHLVRGEVVSAPWGWITPFTLVGGLIGMAICAYLAPIYMTVRTQGALRDDFRDRGIAAGAVLALLILLEIPVGALFAPQFTAKMFLLRSIVCANLALLCGLGTWALLLKGRYHLAQSFAAGTVALILLGFGSTMYPDLLLGTLSIEAAAAPQATLYAFFLVLPFGLLLLGPALFFLYWTFRGTPNPEKEPDEYEL